MAFRLLCFVMATALQCFKTAQGKTGRISETVYLFFFFFFKLKDIKVNHQLERKVLRISHLALGDMANIFHALELCTITLYNYCSPV